MLLMDLMLKFEEDWLKHKEDDYILIKNYFFTVDLGHLLRTY